MARVGSLTADSERFMPWRTIDDENDRPLLEFELEKLVRGFFAPDLLLDYLRYFVLFERTTAGWSRRSPAITSSMRCVRRCRHGDRGHAAAAGNGAEAARHLWQRGAARLAQGRHRVAHPGLGQEHLHGLLCRQADAAAGDGEPDHRRRHRPQRPGRPVVPDLRRCAARCCEETPQQAEDREELRALLAGRPSGGIIFATMQKFMPGEDEDVFPMLSERTNIVVIADEAHRTQYGFEAKLDKKTGKYKYGYAKHLRDALPNATFVAFTGTPVESDDKDTRAVFGDYISIYDIQQAVDDGATVPSTTRAGWPSWTSTG